MGTKIEKAGLKFMAINLLRDGMTETEIAEKLNRHCLENELRDQYGKIWTFSQSSVNRELKEYRHKYRAQAQTKLNKLVNDQIESDYTLVQEAKKYLIGVARDDDKEHPIRERAYMNACKVTFEEWKTALSGGDEDDIATLIADEVKKSLDPELQRKIDAITTRTSDPALQRTH